MSAKTLRDDWAAFMYGEWRSPRLTLHDRFARCPDCQNATVGVTQPYGINHAEGCTCPVLLWAAARSGSTQDSAR